MRANELLLLEGPHDPDRLKAVFMAGGPGSGKTFVARQLLGGSGLKHVNIDDIYEFLRKNRVLSGGYDKELYDHSWNLLRKRMKLYLDGQLGVIIDITGRRLDRLMQTKQELEALGYDTMCVMVNTDVKKALDRNEMRNRKVDPNLLRKMHAEVQQNIGKIQQIFKGKVLFVDNTTDRQDFDHERKIVDQFLAVDNKIDTSKYIKNPPDYVNEDYKTDQRNARAKMQADRNDDMDVIAEQYKEATKFVLENCKEWLAAHNNQPTLAYRGLRGNQDVVLPSVGNYRTNRAPVDSPPILHKLFDAAIAQEGLVANRSNSIFVTGNKDFAKKYGAVFVVFPIGSFNYTWSSAAKDWFMAFHNARPLDFVTLESLSDYTYERILTLASKDSAFDKVIGVWEQDKIVQHYLEYEANINLLRADDLDPSIIDVEKIIPAIHGDDGSLWSALRSGNEVLLSAKRGYYYVPEVFFWKYMVHYLESSGIKIA